MLLVAIATIVLSAAATANTLCWVGTSDDGANAFLSCGSSAGATLWECPAGGGPCTGTGGDSIEFLCVWRGLLGCNQ